MQPFVVWAHLKAFLFKTAQPVGSRTAECGVAECPAHWALTLSASLLTFALLKERKIEHKIVKVVHTVVSMAICVTLTLLRKSNYPLASGDLN